MAECLQIFRARVPQASVAALLEIRPAAIAEAQRLCPDLLGAQLVRLDDTTWLDVLTWSRPDGEQRLLQRATEFDAITKTHDLLIEVELLRDLVGDAGAPRDGVIFSVGVTDGVSACARRRFSRARVLTIRGCTARRRPRARRRSTGRST